MIPKGHKIRSNLPVTKRLTKPAGNRKIDHMKGEFKRSMIASSYLYKDKSTLYKVNKVFVKCSTIINKFKFYNVIEDMGG